VFTASGRADLVSAPVDDRSGVRLRKLLGPRPQGALAVMAVLVGLAACGSVALASTPDSYRPEHAQGPGAATQSASTARVSDACPARKFGAPDVDSCDYGDG
jgi:hypothetical protein